MPLRENRLTWAGSPLACSESGLIRHDIEEEVALFGTWLYLTHSVINSLREFIVLLGWLFPFLSFVRFLKEKPVLVELCLFQWHCQPLPRLHENPHGRDGKIPCSPERVMWTCLPVEKGKRSSYEGRVTLFHRRNPQQRSRRVACWEDANPNSLCCMAKCASSLLTMAVKASRVVACARVFPLPRDGC